MDAVKAQEIHHAISDVVNRMDVAVGEVESFLERLFPPIPTAPGADRTERAELTFRESLVDSVHHLESIVERVQRIPGRLNDLTTM